MPTPKEILSDRKVAVLLDDLLQDCLDAVSIAEKLNRSKLVKSLDNDTRTRFNKCIDKVLIASKASEAERDRCLDGKSKDTKKLRAYLVVQVNALDTLEEFNGRLQILEDNAVEANLAAFLSLIVIVQGANGELVMIQRRLLALSKKLEKAIRAARDARIKGMVGAAIGGLGVCLVPCGLGIALIGGLAMAGAELALRQVLNGNEETTLKKTWSTASTAGAVADGLGAMPKSFAPVMVLLTGGVDLAECFSTERDKAAVEKEIAALFKEMKRVLPKSAKQFKQLEKVNTDVQKSVKRALASVRSFRPGAGGGHALLRML